MSAHSPPRNSERSNRLGNHVTISSKHFDDDIDESFSAHVRDMVRIRKTTGHGNNPMRRVTEGGQAVVLVTKEVSVTSRKITTPATGRRFTTFLSSAWNKAGRLRKAKDKAKDKTTLGSKGKKKK